jgi:predicted dehydrogenase
MMHDGAQVVRVGLVGAGDHGSNVLFPALVQIANVKIVAVADLGIDRAKTIAERVGAPAFRSASELMTSTAPDALVVACYPQAHADIAAEALERGIDVFVEKPPTLETSDLVALAQRARDKGVVTAVGMNFRFAPAVQKLRTLASTPKFGRLAHIGLHHFANKPQQPMWGLRSIAKSFMLAQTIHALDLALVFGGKVRSSRFTSLDPTASFTKHDLVFECGAQATILSGNVFPRFDFDISIIGTNAMMVRMDGLWSIDVLDAVVGDYFGPARASTKTWRPSPLDTGFGRPGYLGGIKSFIDCVRSRERFEADFDSLLPVYKVMDSALEQSDERIKSS